VLRQRAQMRQSYMAAMSQANLSANYAGVVRQRDHDARNAAGASHANEVSDAQIAPNPSCVPRHGHRHTRMAVDASYHTWDGFSETVDAFRIVA
jgi:hypothetical protein